MQVLRYYRFAVNSASHGFVRLPIYGLSVLAIAVLLAWYLLGAHNGPISPLSTGLTSNGTMIHSVPAATPKPTQRYGQLPLQFEQNRGQTDSEVTYLARGAGYHLFLTPRESIVALSNDPGDEAHSAIVRMQLVAANPNPAMKGMAPLPGKVNYLIGPEPSDWHTGIPTYAQVETRDVYPGIDLRYHGKHQQLEYDFIVHPGAKVESIRMAFSGVEDLQRDRQGNLILQTPSGSLTHRKPIIYQEIDGQRTTVEGQYKTIQESQKFRNQDNDPAHKNEDTLQVGFQVAAYNPNYPLIIDPILDYSTYLGGEDKDTATDIAVDDTGHAYITGTTRSLRFPTALALQPQLNGKKDNFVVKLSPAGDSLVYATYIGGSGDDGGDDNDANDDDQDIDKGNALAVNHRGEAFLVGKTDSIDYPIVNGFQPKFGGGATDAYLVKLSSDGSTLLYSTFLGSKKLDVAVDVAVDSLDQAVVVGHTLSNRFPLANAIQPAKGGKRDGFITQFSADGSQLIFSTLLGGSKQERIKAVALDHNGNIRVVGFTRSNLDFPLLNAIQPNYGGGNVDGFLAGITADGGSLEFSTYLGGEGSDKAKGIALDTTGHIVIVGQTKSTRDFPLVNPLQAAHKGKRDAFVTKLLPDASAIVFSTYFGGAKKDKAQAVGLDQEDRITLTGFTQSPDLTTVEPLQATFGGSGDAFVTQLSADGSQLLFSTYLGGRFRDQANALAIDQSGSTYVAGVTKSKADFPLQNPLQPLFGGKRDAFVAKLGADNQPPEITSTPGTTADLNVPYSYDVEASDPDEDPLTYSLTVSPDGMQIDGTSGLIVWTPGVTGNFAVTVAVSDGQGSTVTQSFTLIVADTTPPVISITAPPNGLITSQSQQTIIGSINENGTLTVGGAPVTLNPDNSFAHPVTLAEGTHPLRIEATDSAGNSTTQTLTLTLDTLPPIITVTNPPTADSVTNQDQLILTGTLNEPATLDFNGTSVPIGADLSFSIGPLTLSTGLNTFTLTATDVVGLVSTQIIRVTLDTEGPEINLLEPLDNTLTNQADVVFSGGTNKPVTLTINGQPVSQNLDQTFQVTMTLEEGANAVTVLAVDSAGNTDTVTVNVTVDSTPPAVPNTDLIGRGNPAQGIVMVTGQPGAIEPGILVRVINPTNGNEALVLAQSDGSFSTDVSGFANDSFSLFAVDAAGNQSPTVNLSPNLPLSLTLDPIGNKTAPLGQTTRFTVIANDSNGDPITLGLSPLPLPAGMAYNIVSGEVSFTPNANQVGEIDLTFSAESNDERVVESITLTVPGLNSADPTIFAGRVLDAQSMEEGALVPIVGATLTFLNSGVTTTTDSNGDFTLTNLPATAEVLSIDGRTAQPAPDGASYASFREALPVTQHVLNRVERPFFMPRLATESLTTVDPAQTTVVTNATLGTSLTVPPNTALNEDGTPFTGQLSISVVPRNLAPAEMPEESDPALLVTIQPVGVQFATPVPITFPNVDNLPPGAEVEIISLDPDTGTFVPVGLARVSADQQSLETFEGGVRQADWHFFNSTPAQGVSQSNPDNQCDCPKADGSSKFTLSDGRMSTRFSLPAYRSLEASRGLTFIYQTQRAKPMPVIPMKTGLGPFIAAPITLSTKLTVAGLQQGQEVFVDGSALVRPIARPDGAPLDSFMGVAFDARDFSTRLYPYRLIISNNYAGSSLGTITPGDVLVENEVDSAFGAGWMLNGLYRLAFNGDGSILIISPEGRPINYRPGDIPDEFTTPDNDFATFIRNPDGSFTHTEKDGVKMDFNQDGQLTRHQDRNNNSTTYLYDADGTLETITDPVGLLTTLVYDLNGLLDTVTDPAGRISRFEYDSTGNLLKITYPDNTFETFEYDDRHLMTAHEDERKNRYTDRYDAFGRVIDGTLPDGTVRAMQAQHSVGLVDVSSGLGTPSNPAPAALEANAGYTDGRGNPSKQEVDRHGRALMTVDEVGRVTTHVRDADSNPTQTTRPIGSVVTRTFDDFGNVLTQREEFNTATTTFIYDQFSLVTSITNPRDHTTIINRDPANGNPLTVVNHLGHTATMVYDTRGLVTKMTSPNGLVTDYTYNAEGLMDTQTETPPAGSPGNVRVWTYDYFPTGLLKTVVTPDNITLNHTYDERSYLTSVTDNLNQSIVYTYDEHKNVVKTESTNADGSLALLVDSIYDNRNRLTATKAPHVDAEESVTQRILDPNSNLIGLIDPNGNPASNGYDPYNRLETNTHREDGITQYTYDDQDRIIKLIASNGVATDYEYDIISRRIREISPDRGTLAYSYDLANNVTTITEGRGITATMTYDELERVSTKTYPNTLAGKIEDVTYTYDSCPFGLGFLCARSDESGSYRYEYDAFGNMTQGTFTEIAGIIYTMGYVYDEGDHIIQATYPSGRTVDYARDGVRRVEAIDTTVNGTPQNIVGAIQYRGDNQMTQCTYGNGLSDTRSYDLQGRLLTQQLTDALGNIIDERTYTYDKNSNILTIDTNIEDNGYQYDKLDRVINDTIDADTPIDFGYDLNDNRLSKQLADLSRSEITAHAEGTNRIQTQETLLTGVIPIDPVADRELVYNDVGRLYQLFEDGILKAEYIYNDQGQRTRKTTYQADGITIDAITIYHYDHMGYLITETTETGQLIKDYIWTEGMHPVAQIDNTLGTENVLYLYNDHLMTNRLATDQSQTVIWRWEGEAFGNTPADEIGGFSINLRFPGQYFDQETGLHYNYFRYYDPSTGRYISSDPIGLEGGLNTYAYVSNNPLSHIDPFGLAEFPNNFVGPLPPDGYFTFEMTQTKCGKVPPAPPGVNINKNIQQADDSWNPFWFYNQVRNNGPWDYKQQGRKYEDFGNFNFGATGAAFGFPDSVLYRGAGWANQKADPTRKGLGSPLGGYPYGDTPNDQAQIGKGINYCQCTGY